ncbi:MAG: hypothetical protein AABW86_03065 [Candidatus Micrarchaeota archaeon]
MSGTHFSHNERFSQKSFSMEIIKFPYNKLFAVSLVFLLLSGAAFSGWFDNWKWGGSGSSGSSGSAITQCPSGQVLVAGKCQSVKADTDVGSGTSTGTGTGIYIPPAGTLCPPGQIKVGGVCQFTALGSGAGSTLGSALNAGAGPEGNIGQALFAMCGTIKSALAIGFMLLAVLAAIVYALGQMMGAETRARATVWATSMIVGAIFGALIYVLMPMVLDLLLNDPTMDVSKACS